MVYLVKQCLVIYLNLDSELPSLHFVTPSLRGACIEKESANVLLLRSSTLALGLVELGLGSKAGQPESLDSTVDSRVYRYIWVGFHRTGNLAVSCHFKKNFARPLGPNLIFYATFFSVESMTI